MERRVDMTQVVVRAGAHVALPPPPPAAEFAHGAFDLLTMAGGTFQADLTGMGASMTCI